jgi:transcriptional regulator with XRE-family HTH domain
MDGINLAPETLRAARALLGISQRELAIRLRCSPCTLALAETGARTPHARTLRDIGDGLIECGIRFVPAARGRGVAVALAEAEGTE